MRMRSPCSAILVKLLSIERASARFSSLEKGTGLFRAPNPEIISAREVGARNRGCAGDNRLGCCPYSERCFSSQMENALKRARARSEVQNLAKIVSASAIISKGPVPSRALRSDHRLEARCAPEVVGFRVAECATQH